MWLLDAYCFCRDEMAPNLLRQGMLKTHSDTWPATDCACATFGHVDVQETLPGHWQLFFFWSFHGRKTHFPGHCVQCGLAIQKNILLNRSDGFKQTRA